MHKPLTVTAPDSAASGLTLRRRTFIQSATALAMTAPLSTRVLAAGDGTAFPSKPVRVIVPFAAGGATDVLARAVCEKMGASLGQSVVVDNRPGGAGLIGGDAVAKAAPDGHTLYLGTTSTVLSMQFLFKKMPFDPQKDFVPISRICNAPITVVVSAQLPVNTVQELLDYAKRNKSKLSYGSYGMGSQGHLVCASLSNLADADMTHIAYKGEAPMVQDLLGGQLMIGVGSALTLKQHVDSGKLRALAFTGTRRVPALPEVPTFSELGFNQEAFVISGWLGMVVTGGTPPAVVERLGMEVSKALKTREVNARVVAAGFITTPEDTPAQFRAAWMKELVIWKKLLQDAGVQPT